MALDQSADFGEENVFESWLRRHKARARRLLAVYVYERLARHEFA